MREFSLKSASRRIPSVGEVADIVWDRAVEFNYRLRKFAYASTDQLIGFTTAAVRPRMRALTYVDLFSCKLLSPFSTEISTEKTLRSRTLAE